MIFSSIHGIKAVEYLRHYMGEYGEEARTIRLTVATPGGGEDYIDLTLFGDTWAIESLPRADGFVVFGDDGKPVSDDVNPVSDINGAERT